MKFGIPTAAVPITDPKTGLGSAPWYLFFRHLLDSVWASSDGSPGVSGTFTAGAQVITVKDGIIVSIV